MPAGDLHSKPPCGRDDAVAVVQRLTASGHIAYFAGGCVRDVLLGLEPKDYDVATDARPDQVALFKNTQAVGQAFGVILVRLGRSVVEVATFRSDGVYSDGRRPDTVHFTTAEHDAQRRDFTINGLFLDPVDNRIIDYVGGQQDLKDRLLRAIGNADARFQEDHLRLMRAVRFAARFGFTVEPQTELAIRRHAPQLAHISPERVGEEMRSMLTPRTRTRAWRELRESGLGDIVFRFMPSLPAGDGEIAGRRYQIFDAFAADRPVGFGPALAAATLDRAYTTWPAWADFRMLFDKPLTRKMVQALRQSLKVSNDEGDAMADTLEGLAPLLRDDPPALAVMKRFLGRPAASWSRDLLSALRGPLDRARLDWLEARLAELEKTDFAPPPLITGDDLTNAGMAPGPVFKRVLEAVYDAQLEGRVTGKEEAMKLALRLAQEGQ